MIEIEIVVFVSSSASAMLKHGNFDVLEETERERESAVSKVKSRKGEVGWRGETAAALQIKLGQRWLVSSRRGMGYMGCREE